MKKRDVYYRCSNLLPQGITTTIPDKFFLVAGHSEGITPLNAFDSALIDAGIGNTNLMKMSSILPPNSKKIQPIKLPLGSLVPLAYASKISSVTGEIISAGVACAVPMDKNKNGLIMEYSAPGHKHEIEKIVRHMAEVGMKNRGYKIKTIYSISTQHPVKKIGAVFAAVVLWW
ncbi:MAG: arginine decarboxylase, pyruvoyl-dependent [Candidatus Goldbacteria bacterium]|nr:arginine decarboxylase, pyruvoyl-dependent [Candidatus Goldiibacteriota bacterium]HPD19219.1 arginine decarboxylase, pyruvoyl-dependent [Candidatus Goldiibacteriota bacterium]